MKRTERILLTTLVALALPAPSAFAGRLVATGHDADFHCGYGIDQCHSVEVATRYVRGGAPDPGKPVLVLDRGELLLSRALDRAFGPGAVPRVVMDPRGGQFAAEPLLTSRWSAIMVASDASCGGCDLNEATSTPDSAAIASRAADIRAFFNGGGGVYAGAGGERADAYYRFLPFAVTDAPLGGFLAPTSAGEALGFTAGDATCCATHNGFAEPELGTLGVAEQDEREVAVTLFVEGTVGARPGEPPPPPGAPAPEPPPPGPPPPPPGEFASQTAPPPAATESVVVKPVGGKVLVKLALPGEEAERKEAAFAPLKGAANIPVGSTVDVRGGTLNLATEGTAKGALDTADFFSGVFKVRQARKSDPLELELTGGDFKKACGEAPPPRGARSAAKRRKRAVRRLWGKGKGRFRTRGRFSATTVRGTLWLTEDRCDGTLTTVRQGSVAVDDLVRKRRVALSAPRSYLARAPRKLGFKRR